MDREIKFRGKRIFNDEWVYGFYWRDCTDGIHKITVSNIGDDNFRDYEVIPETVGEYIGLKDKKRTPEFPEGQEIYEGDIVKDKYSIGIYEVVYNNKECQFQGKQLQSFDCIDNHNDEFRSRENLKGRISQFHIYKDLEILGNKFDNPELEDKC